MADRFEKNERPDLFSVPPDTAEDFAELYGVDYMKEEERKRIRVRLIPLTEIMPDPVQPRRGMPEDIRNDWLTDPGSVSSVTRCLNLWAARTMEETHNRNRPALDVVGILSNQEDDASPDVTDPPPGPYEVTFIKLLRDAATVYDHGLEHPITVVRVPGDTPRWMIQSGERRTLMHWALVVWLGDQQFSEIPAIEIPAADVWRQAAENNAREDLTAIEKARQLALLLMDLYPEKRFKSYQDAPGQGFYQQAVDLRVPYGKTADLLAAMGLKGREQITRYRRILELPSRVWELADQHRWSENRIREVRSNARDDDHLLQLALFEVGERLEKPVKNADSHGELLPTGNNLAAANSHTPTQGQVGVVMDAIDAYFATHPTMPAIGITALVSSTGLSSGEVLRACQILTDSGALVRVLGGQYARRAKPARTPPPDYPSYTPLDPKPAPARYVDDPEVDQSTLWDENGQIPNNYGFEELSAHLSDAIGGMIDLARHLEGVPAEIPAYYAEGIHGQTQSLLDFISGYDGRRGHVRGLIELLTEVQYHCSAAILRASGEFDDHFIDDYEGEP